MGGGLRWGSVLLTVAIAFAAVIGYALLASDTSTVSSAELLSRCQAAEPAWSNYDEDIKAQVGARPFAEWQGEPIAAEQTPEGLRITFRIHGPWAGRNAAMPILIRDGLGAVQRDTAAVFPEPGLVVYRFESSRGFGLALDSVEVRYPRHIRRVLVQQAVPVE